MNFKKLNRRGPNRRKLYPEAEFACAGRGEACRTGEGGITITIMFGNHLISKEEKGPGFAKKDNQEKGKSGTGEEGKRRLLSV